jgi:hypothetical protein
LPAAQRWAFDSLSEELIAACAAASEWPLGIAAAVGRAVEIATEAPGEARLVLISHHAVSEPRLASEGLDVPARLLELLDAGARSWPGSRAPRAETTQLAVAAALSMAGACLTARDLEALARLEPDLVQIVLAPYLGANEATRVSQAA